MDKNSQKFRMIHHVDQATIDRMYGEYSPVFVLTTGRTGSRLLVEMVNLSVGLSAFHEPRPTLQYFSNFAYHHQNEGKLLRHMVAASRMESILDVMIRDRIYVESNQCLTFFAPALIDLFPNARFIHLVRHPGDFVRSAWRKGWHRNDSIWESGRVRMADEGAWEKMDLVEKLAWVWAATNGFIETFISGIGSERIFRIRMEDLIRYDEAGCKLAEFCGGGPPDPDEVARLRGLTVNSLKIGENEPPNMRKRTDFLHYQAWTDSMRKCLDRQCGNLSEKYGYSLKNSKVEDSGKGGEI